MLLPAEGRGLAQPCKQIVLDARGNFASAYNVDGLTRGYITADGQITIQLYDK